VQAVHPGQHERDVVTVSPRSKGKGDVFCTEEGSAKDGEGEEFGFTERVSVPISQACFVSEPDLLNLIQNGREKAEHQRNHQPHPAPRKKRDRFQKPDEGPLEVSRTSHRRKEDGMAEKERQPPTGDSSQAQPFPADREPRGSRPTGARSEKGMNKEEGKKENHPGPGVPKERPQG